MCPMDPDIDEKLKQTGVAFLSGDIEAALTFLQLARTADKDSAKQVRNQANARRAYDVVQKMSARLELAPEQQNQIEQKLRNLRAELEALGERF